MNTNNKIAAANPPDFQKIGVPRSLGDMTEKGNAQVKDAFEKTSAATVEATDALKSCCFTAIKGAQDYTSKLMEFARANNNSAFDFIQKLYDVKSPQAFVELSTKHSREQFEAFTDQSNQLATLAQKASSAAAEPVKAAVSRAFNLPV